MKWRRLDRSLPPAPPSVFETSDEPWHNAPSPTGRTETRELIDTVRGLTIEVRNLRHAVERLASR